MTAHRFTFGLLMSAVIAITAAMASAADESVKLENGDIEQGLSGWNFNAAPNVKLELSEDIAHAGKRSLTVSVPTGTKGWYGFRQKINIAEAGTSVTIKAYVKAQNVEGRVGIYVHAVDRQGKLIYNYLVPTGEGSYDWKQVRHSFEIPEGTAYLDVGTALNGSGQAWYDDFTLSVERPGDFVSKAAPAGSPPTTLPPDFKHTSYVEMRARKWDISQRGRKLDLSGYVESFRDDFKTNTITPDGGSGPWYAPVHGPFGAGVFLPPGGPIDPFALVPEGLRIRAKRVGGKWNAGLIQTVDSKGNGFAQQYGYFEMTAKFPSGVGPWPAFWLLSRDAYIDPTKTRVEMDVIEWYGGDPNGHHTTVHLWPAKYPQPGAITRRAGVGRITHLVKEGVFSEVNWQEFHSYGVEVTPEYVTMYMDRVELERFPMVPEMHTPMYMLVNLAVFEGQADDAASPLDMVIKNVTAYKQGK